jgi:hypothetical protein
MNSKCPYLFSFSTYEHNVYIKEFRFFKIWISPIQQINTLKTKFLLSANNIIPMATILHQELGKPPANVIHYSMKHLHRNSFDFLLNSIFQLLNCVGCWRIVDLRFETHLEKWFTCGKIGWTGWPCDVPMSEQNMVRKKIPHSCHGISCGVTHSSFLLKKCFFGYWMMSKLRT